MTPHSGFAALVLASFVMLPACARQSDTAAAGAVAQGEPVAARDTPRGPADVAHATKALPLAVVHKNPSCGCCGSWAEHMRKAGFPVEVREVDNLNPIKERLGVPAGKGSCHTVEIDGYMIEGHVPADDIKRLLAERPDARGLVLPGMPMGSPGMESPDGSVEPYTVELVQRDGTTVAFATHGQ